MSGLRALVAAVDFSPASAPAVVRAAALAERTGAALHLLFAHLVFRTESAPSETAESVLRLRLERFAADALAVSRRDLDARAPVVAVERGVSAPDAICAYAERVEADLLVLGTHGRSGIGRLLLGSVAEGCVNRACGPVLTVPESAPPRPDAPVLVPVDLSSRTPLAIRAAREWAAREGAPLEAVHVLRDAGSAPDLAPELFSLSDTAPEAAEHVRQRLGPLTDDLARLHVVSGSPARAIAHVAEERGARLLVMATRARRGIGRAFAGSVAGATLRHAPCPVLTLSEKASGHRMVQTHARARAAAAAA